MFLFIKERRVRLFCKVLSCVISVVFAVSTISPSIAMAQSVGMLNLPIPGTMVNVSPAFVPVLLKGMTIFPDNPLKFDFILDSGNTDLTQEEMKKESERLVKYFLASMTVPKDDLWVNLSPYEDDRIIPDELGKTELGRDLLAQDYLLKQLTASLMYPEDDLGKEFWNRVYAKAEEQFGTTDIPVDTFNKVWILPESATVYENEYTVYVVQSRLKVMLDSDYVAMSNGTENTNSGSTMEIGESIIREIIIPEIEKEVNAGKNFAPLRQIYHSLILAKWYKETIKNSLLSSIYVDQNKTAGVELDDTGYKEEIYAQYIEAYKKGVFDLIKEDYDELSQEVVPRKYFSGGIKDEDIELGKTTSARTVSSSVVGKNIRLELEVEPQKDGVTLGRREFLKAAVIATASALVNPGSLLASPQEQVSSGFSRKKYNTDNPSPLNKVILDGNYDEVKYLLESGANPNEMGFNKYGGKRSLLRLAIFWSKNPDIVEILLRHGANLDGNELFELVTSSDDRQMAKVLLEYGADGLERISGDQISIQDAYWHKLNRSKEVSWTLYELSKLFGHNGIADEIYKANPVAVFYSENKVKSIAGSIVGAIAGRYLFLKEKKRYSPWTLNGAREILDNVYEADSSELVRAIEVLEKHSNKDAADTKRLNDGKQERVMRIASLPEDIDALERRLESEPSLITRPDPQYKDDPYSAMTDINGATFKTDIEENNPEIPRLQGEIKRKKGDLKTLSRGIDRAMLGSSIPVALVGALQETLVSAANGKVVETAGDIGFVDQMMQMAMDHPGIAIGAAVASVASIKIAYYFSSPWTLTGARWILDASSHHTYDYGVREPYEKELLKVCRAIKKVANSAEAKDKDRLKAILVYPDDVVRETAEGYLSHDQKVDGYIDIIKSKKYIRGITIENSINALYDLGDKKALEPLIALLSRAAYRTSGDNYELAALERAIIKLSSKEIFFNNLLNALLTKQYSAFHRNTMMNSLLELDPQKTFEALFEVIDKEGDPEIALILSEYGVKDSRLAEVLLRTQSRSWRYKKRLEAAMAKQDVESFASERTAEILYKTLGTDYETGFDWRIILAKGTDQLLLRLLSEKERELSLTPESRTETITKQVHKGLYYGAGEAYLETEVVGTNEVENPWYYEIKQRISEINAELERRRGLISVSEHEEDADIKVDKDQLGEDPDVGGINMNEITVDRQGAGVDIQFDDAGLQSIIDMGIDGFAPVIINLTPISSILPMLGLVPEENESEKELSSLGPMDRIS